MFKKAEEKYLQGNNLEVKETTIGNENDLNNEQISSLQN